MKELEMMIGLPRSGKSTLVQQGFNGEGAIVSADRLRFLVYGQRFFAEGEPMVWAIREILLKSLMENGSDLIIDETNTTMRRRAEIIKLAKRFGYKVHAIYVDTPTEVCIARAEESGQPDLIPVIERMAQQFEAPHPSEGFESIVHTYKHEYGMALVTWQKGDEWNG